MEKLKKTAWIWGSLALLAVAIAIVALMLSDIWPWGDSAGNIQVMPTALSADGSVEPDSGFVLQGSAELEETDLRARITTVPEFVFGLRRGETGDWELLPAVPFAPESDLELRVGNARYTAKVAPTLLVVTSAPKSGSQGMNPHTGVEFTFNTTVSSAALQEAISVSPSFDFSLGEGDGRVVLYPDGGLQYNTDYTITLRKDAFAQGALRLREDFVLSFKTVSQLGEQVESALTLRGNNTYNTLTDEAPMLQLYIDKQMLPQPELTVTLYQYPDAAAYKAAVADSLHPTTGKIDRSLEPDTTGLVQYASFAAELVEMEERSTMLPFPEKLPEGWYLAEIACPTGKTEPDGSEYILRRYKLIQSSDLSVFFMHSDEELVLWTNDAATGKPAEGATFAVTGQVNSTPATTDKDGIAILSQAGLRPNNWGAAGVFTLEWQGHSFVDGAMYNSGYQDDAAELLYQSTLFTDRPLYRTTDTVQVWGYLRPRRTETPMPKKVQLMADGVDPVEVTPNERGLFTTTMSLQSMSDTYLSLQLMVDDKQLDSETIRVYDYVKPQYTATLTPDKPVYLLSENPEPVIMADISMFDGTPVPDWRGTIEEWSDSLTLANGGKFVTDQNGNASVTATGISTDSTSWYPAQVAYSLKNNQAEEENFLASGYLYIIPRDLMLQTTLAVKENRGTVTLTANRVDISGITAPEQLYVEPEKTLRGAPVSVQVTAKLRSVQMVKIPSGTSYDYINRVSVPRYDYKRIEKDIKTMSLNTDQNGTLFIPDLPCYDKDTQTRYYLELSANDSAGRLTTTTVYLYPEWHSYYQSDNAYNYGLQRVIDPAKLQKADGSNVDEWTLYSQFGDGETANFHLENNNDAVDIGGGRILYATVQDRFENVKLSDRAVISIPFAEQLLPNYTLVGAYFDGKHIFSLDSNWLYFNPEKRELDVQIASDKEVYAPGAAATLNLTVTEKTSGKPAADADVVVAVVDEAVFAIAEQYVDPLGDLYRNVFYPTITYYTSFNNPEFGGAGEKGGGGGDDAIRQDFRDTALFATATTDSEGHAKLEFALPDSITSWRVTALGLTRNGYAGDNRDNVIATKDFFVTPIRNTEQLAGDEITIGLRSAGRSVQPADTVQYSVTLEGTDVNQTLDVETEGIRTLGWASFGAVPAGDYTVTVRGSCGSYTDAVKLPISVVASGIEVSKYRTFDLASEPLAINTLRYPVTVTLYDKQYALYNQVMCAVGNASYGVRCDMRLGRVMLDRIYGRSDPTGGYTGSGEKVADLQWNPLRLFPTDENYDLRLTAYAYLAMPEQLGDYCGGSWNDPTATPLESYELAAPGAFYILQAINGNLAQGKQVDTTGFKLPDLLDLAVAQHLAGDTAEAQKTFETLVLPKLQKSTGLSGVVALSLPETDGVSAMACTAAASRLATVLGRAEADGLMRYLVERHSRYDPYIIEKLLYLAKRDSVAATNPASVSYMQDGQQVQYSFTTAMRTLSLSRSQLEALNLKVVSGEVMADVRYTAPATEADAATKKFKITKTVAPVSGEEYRVGDLVKVTLTPDVSGFATDIGDAELLVDDYLPAGMKFERFEPNYNANRVNWYLQLRQEQRLRFSAWNANAPMQPIVYYARNTIPGSYIIEGAFVSSGAGDVWGSSDRGSVSIQP